MLNFRSKSTLIGAWCTIIVAAAGVGAALGMRAPLVAFALIVGLTPAAIFQYLGRAPKQTMAEVLRGVDGADRTH